MAKAGALSSSAKRRICNIEEVERQFRTLAENIPAMVMRFDADLHCTYANPFVEKYTGFKAAELLGRTTREMGMFQKPAPLWDVALGGVFRTGCAAIEEFVFDTPKGERRFEMRLLPEVASDASTPSVLAVARDITAQASAGQSIGASENGEHQRSETALQEAQLELAHLTRLNTMGEFAASIAHEINQLLAAMVANADAGLHWLHTRPANLDEARECVEGIIRAGVRAGEVIQGIRGLARKRAMQLAPLRMNDVIEEVIVLARGEVERKRAVLKAELAPDLPLVLGNRVQLEQVLLNLMLNGMEAMSEVRPEQRRLVVGSGPGDSGVVVYVRDRGAGIRAEVMQNIYKSFFTTKPGGTGVGLSISRTIVEAHHGRLWATPNKERGMTFSFSIPEAGQ